MKNGVVNVWEETTESATTPPSKCNDGGPTLLSNANCHRRTRRTALRIVKCEVISNNVGSVCLFNCEQMAQFSQDPEQRTRATCVRANQRMRQGDEERRRSHNDRR
jgi:hypothetical protein